MKKIAHLFQRFQYELGFLILFISLRLPSLGHDTFNTDVWKWKSRIYNFGQGVFTLDFAQTVQRYHPGVTLMWLGAVGVKLNSFYYKVLLGYSPPDNDIVAIFTLNFFQKLAIVCGIAIVLATVLYPLRIMFGKKAAFLMVLFLSLEPLYVALTREIHLEGLLTTFFVAAFVYSYFLYYKNYQSKTVFGLAAFYTACAILTKTSALIILPYMFLFFFFSNYTSDVRLKSWVISKSRFYLKWLLLVFIFVLMLWPALWVMPVQVVQTLYAGIFETGVEEGHIQYYFSRLVDDPGPTFYFVVLGLRSSAFLILGLVGYLAVWKKLPIAHRHFAFYAFLFGFFYFIEMTIPSKKLDRYLMPTIGLFSFIAAMFYLHALKYVALKTRISSKLSVVAFVVVCTLNLTIYHYDYFSYYNPLFGGLRAGIWVLEPKWLIGTSQTVDSLKQLMHDNQYETFPQGDSIDSYIENSLHEPKFIVAFPEKYFTQIHPFIQEFGGRAVIEDLGPHARIAKYIVYPVWDDKSATETRFKLSYVTSVKLRNVAVYNIYKRIGD